MSGAWSRREVLRLLGGGAALWPALARAGEAAEEPPTPAPAGKVPKVEPQPLVRVATIQSQHAGKQHVVFVLPPDYETSQKTYPAVLAFGGYGESIRGNEAGAWGWVELYGAVGSMAALSRGRLTHADMQGLLVADADLEDYNRALAAQPWRGVVLVSPWPANNLRRKSPALPDYERFIIEELIPYTRRHLRVAQDWRGWGVDGVSLGGLLSVWFGVSYPEQFASIGSLQGSVSSYPWHIEQKIREKLSTLKTRAINVVTSRGDGFREDLLGFDKALDKLGLPHRFTLLPGAHNKVFLHGPGCAELFLFHDRALWGSGDLPPERDLAHWQRADQAARAAKKPAKAPKKPPRP